MYGQSRYGHWLILAVNVLGACIMFYYLWKYLEHSDGEEEFQWALVCPIAGFFVTLFVGLFYFSDRERNLLFLAWTCGLSRGLTALVPLV
jgi:uncharacterized membrane protein YpjA